jgi:hypothetical protein
MEPRYVDVRSKPAVFRFRSFLTVRVVSVSPDQATTHTLSYLFVGGGANSNEASPVDLPGPFALQVGSYNLRPFGSMWLANGLRAAMNNKILVAEVRQVPNQPYFLDSQSLSEGVYELFSLGKSFC